MQLSSKKTIKWNYLVLAFAFPVIAMLIYLLVAQFVGMFGPYKVPFGKTTMLYSDMYHQYYPFFLDFRRALLSGESLLYSWSVGMGMDYLGLISYYLASPLNLLSVLFPESWMLGYFTLLVPIKLGLASLFFAIFLKKMFNQNDLSISIFGSFYGLCGWALAYQWNIMWLDTFALLPLVALGTVSLLRDKKFFLYTITLFLSIYSNYYIGFFTCIFVLLLFICFEICRFRGFKALFQDLCRIALFSLLAIGMTAFLELPALAALQNTQSVVNQFPEGFRLNIAKENTWKGLLDAMRQVAGNMGGGLTPSFKEGLPNLYCGVGTVILAFLFLSAKEVKLRDKICSVALLIFFILSVIIRQLDYIWHGFHFTNMIPYRFTFLYSFVLLYMAYRAYLLRSSFTVTRIVIAGVLALGVFACSDFRLNWMFLGFNCLFLLLYLSVLLYGATSKKIPEDASAHTVKRYQAANILRKQYSVLLLAVVMVVELVMNVTNFGSNFTTTSAKNYPKGTQALASMVNYMKEREDDNLFYRTEVTHSQTLNDGALIGYQGISTFTSSANVRVTEFMQALGYGAKNTYNRYCFEESSPVANLFLGLKYMLERDNYKENAYFDKVHSYGNITLLENNAYLPLGFLANSQLTNIDFAAMGDRFNFQNRLLSAASGISGNAWNKLTGNALTITGDGVTVSNQSANGYCYFETGESSGKVVYRYQSDMSGLLCIDLDLSKRNSYTVLVDGKEVVSETYSLPQMLSVCDITPDSVVEIHLVCKANEKGTINIKAAVLNEPFFRHAYSILNASTLELTSFHNTHIEGVIQCDRDGILYTSIPQNGGWTATVDGTPVEIVTIGNAMVGVPLTIGEHTVSLTYHDKAFSLGWKISLFCVLALAALTFVFYPPKRTLGKYEKSK